MNDKVTAAEAKAEAKKVYFGLDSENKSADDFKDFVKSYLDALREDGYLIEN